MVRTSVLSVCFVDLRSIDEFSINFQVLITGAATSSEAPDTTLVLAESCTSVTEIIALVAAIEVASLAVLIYIMTVALGLSTPINAPGYRFAPVNASGCLRLAPVIAPGYRLTPVNESGCLWLTPIIKLGLMLESLAESLSGDSEAESSDRLHNYFL